MANPDGIAGHVFRRGEHGYEEARRGSVWCAGVPDRYPSVIVQAQDENDALAAVRLARDEKLKIAVRSGGHSWPGNHLRDGTVLIDVNALKDASVDVGAMTATAQPGLRGSDLNGLLADYELFFPTGHCRTVCIGGYLLQGGYAWHGRAYGPACMSVIGIDAVTAAGELVHADENQNTDLLWAARGAGPGFFALVTRFHVMVYPRPRIHMFSVYRWLKEDFEEVFRWAHAIGKQTELELIGMVYRDDALSKDPLIQMTGIAFADSTIEAKKLLAELETCPARPRVVQAATFMRQSLANLTAGSDSHYLPDRRYIADNVWYDNFEPLIPGMKTIIDRFPPHPSHVMWTNWGYVKAPLRNPMAWSLDGDFYWATYAAYRDPTEDEKYKKWITDRFRTLEPYSKGVQLADENLINRPARFISDENMTRLDELRAQWDPDGLFPTWLGRL